ncbi:hypothetical protein [Sorangium cellulosum]|nr:hypothetical protein [Sorangium cellulosum]
MTHTTLLLIPLASLLLAACGPVIIDGTPTDDIGQPVAPAHDGGTDGCSGEGGSDGGGEPGPTTLANAMTRAQSDALWDEYWAQQEVQSGSTGGGGTAPELDPDDLFLRISDVGVTCDSPTTHLTCGGHWKVNFIVPTAYQQVGVYDINAPGGIGVTGNFFETGEPYTPGSEDDCAQGGGTLWQGTLEILAINDAEVRFRLDVGSFGDADPSGEYTAPRCP